MKKSDVEHIRHSLAHLLAAAVLKKFPETKLGIGPVIENGFYYDFQFPNDAKINDEILPELEKEMRNLAKENMGFSGKKITPAQAKKMFANQPFKLDLINELVKSKNPLSVYITCPPKTKLPTSCFVDLCKGGHVKNTKEINPEAFKLTKLAGAYWRGNEKNTQLTRVYGVAFETKKELEDHENLLREAERRDHKKLGPQLDLFTFSELVGSGLPLWTPKGTVLRDELDSFVWQLRKNKGYERVDIPHITKKDLYERSGHWEKFQDELFKIKTREGHLFAMKPMNCPHHAQIYKRRAWSYRELPQRYASTTKVYRDEQTGELAGLSRVRSITQDDAHVFCRKSQVKEEILKIWNIIEEFYGAAGFFLRIRLSLHDPKHPEKYLGSPKTWKEAEAQLRALVKERKTAATEAQGEAAFYGPKIDFMAKDSMGREWQVATIQLDMNLPERFDLSCANERGEEERIVMIHAAIMGAIERYLAILIEHFAGAFPLWMAPVQARVLPVSEKVLKYGEEILAGLKAENIRAELTDANETLGKRIREAELQKIPYVIVVGEKETANKSVSVRHYRRGQEGEMKVDDLIAKMKNEISKKII